MAVAVEQFVKSLEQSGIISASNLRAVREKLPTDRQHDAQELGRELVRQKMLTNYQVQEAYVGNADRYQSMSEVVVELERFHPGQDVAGSVSDAQGKDRRVSEFLRGTKGSKAASGNPSGKPVATKRPSSPVLEATMAMAGSQIETDPRTEQSLVAAHLGDRIGTGSAWWKNWRIPAGRRSRILLASAAGATALLLAGIVLYRETHEGRVGIRLPCGYHDAVVVRR